MIVTKSLRDDILEKLKTEDLVIVPASETDYLELANNFPFKIEHHNSEIYTMGLASYIHATLVSTIIGIFYNLYVNNEDYNILASNSGVKIPKFEGGYYMPDVMVVKGKPIFKEKSTSIITNPYIIVEVLSPFTDKFDTESKLPEYKHLESLQHIIFINQKNVVVTLYTRTDKPNVWLNQDFYDINQELILDNNSIKIETIYKKTQLKN